jgi:2-oxo-4-hydroxy-4-carboxy--5-ureidoimidazoline (OHCU) decarboxylase
LVVYLADLLAASGKALEAEVRLDRARVLAPHATYVDEGLARNDIRNGRSDLAVEDYRAALAAGSTNPRAYIVSAQARLDDSQSGGLDYAGEGGFGIATAIQEIRRALVLDPGNTDAYVLLGRAFYVAPTVTEKDIAELKPGLNAGSDGPKVRFYRALLYHRLNQLDRSVAELGAVATDSRAEPSLQAAAISQARREIFDRDRKKVEQAVRAGNFEAAEALLRAALAHPDLATDVDAYRRLKASVDEAQQMSGLIELYNKQRWSELAQAADAFAAAYPKSQNLYQVKAMKKRAARMLQR